MTGFHLDEYVGLPIAHPASFRRYLWERFVSRLPLPLRAFHYLDAEKDPQAECRRVGEIIRRHPIDVAFVGIGENGHLAFNDPPADFETDEPYIVVELDEACRRQQLGEGWFPTLDDVPRQAISMSVRQIMKSRGHHVHRARPAQSRGSSQRGGRRRDATGAGVDPAAARRRCTLFLDEPAATLLSRRIVAARHFEVRQRRISADARRGYFTSSCRFRKRTSVASPECSCSARMPRRLPSGSSRSTHGLPLIQVRMRLPMASIS